MSKTNLQLFLLLVLLIGNSCKKNKDYPIPSVPFDITIDLSLPTYQPLVGVGGWAYVNNAGIKGIVVYHQSQDVFVAWERQSPEDPTNACATGLTPNADNFLQLEDPCSSAKYSMYDGSVIANSEWGLRQYQAIWNGSNLLRIYN